MMCKTSLLELVKELLWQLNIKAMGIIWKESEKKKEARSTREEKSYFSDYWNTPDWDREGIWIFHSLYIYWCALRKKNNSYSQGTNNLDRSQKKKKKSSKKKKKWDRTVLFSFFF